MSLRVRAFQPPEMRDVLRIEQASFPSAWTRDRACGSSTSRSTPLCAGAASFWFTTLDVWAQDGHLGSKVLWLGLAGICGMAAFFAAAAILRVPELSVFFKRLRRKNT